MFPGLQFKLDLQQWRIQDFPEEGAPTPRGGRQHTILPNFPKNCMKLKEFWPGGEGAGARPPPLGTYFPTCWSSPPVGYSSPPPDPTFPINSRRRILQIGVYIADARGILLYSSFGKIYEIKILIFSPIPSVPLSSTACLATITYSLIEFYRIYRIRYIL